MGILGNALVTSRPEDALPVLEADLALRRRYWSYDEELVLTTQTGLANCLAKIGRRDEALVLEREICARRVATLGISNERTLVTGMNLASSLLDTKNFDETTHLLRDQLLPVARRSLGADHNLTLGISKNLANALLLNPDSTRDDLLEAETILQDVVQRRRRAFGPTHPRTVDAETNLSIVASIVARAKLARA